MSSITRVAARSATRVIQRRPMSGVTGVRRWAQGLEPHPFERIPLSQNPQRGDYAKMARRSLSSMVFFVPSAAILLGWPYFGAKALDGHI